MLPLLHGEGWSFTVGFAAVGLGFSAAFTWLVSLTQTIRISQEGVVLYLVNRANWADIVAAERRPFLRLDYLRVRLRSGRRWAIPLFFRGKTSVAEALVTFSPAGHPVQVCLGASRGAV
ncbi:MAG: hypothetical protein JXA69_18585 [Phycisphaerae bacterium]|nr:hypothetical protein [Phycisphaerae bacterium]